MNLSNRRERNGLRRLGAQIKTHGGMEFGKPVFDLGFIRGQMEQSRGLGEKLPRAPLRTEHTYISKRKSERQQCGKNMRILFEAVREQDCGIGWM